MSEKYLNLIKSGSEVVNMRLQSHNIYENILRLCPHLPEDLVYSYINIYQTAFIERFVKAVIEMADSTEVQQTDQFSSDLKRFSELEREIYDQHRRQRIAFSIHKNAKENRQVDVSYELMDEDMKIANKRMRV